MKNESKGKMKVCYWSTQKKPAFPCASQWMRACDYLVWLLSIFPHCSVHKRHREVKKNKKKHKNHLEFVLTTIKSLRCFKQALTTIQTFHTSFDNHAAMGRFDSTTTIRLNFIHQVCEHKQIKFSLLRTASRAEEYLRSQKNRNDPLWRGVEDVKARQCLKCSPEVRHHLHCLG